MNTFHLTVTTPESVLIDAEVNEVIIPTTEGEITILPEHAALVAQISLGEMIIQRNGKSESLALSGGFVQVVDKKEVIVLADYAAKGEDLSVIEAEKAVKRAQQAILEKKSVEDTAIIEADLRRAILDLKVAQKNKGR